jgi:hypothetical protein
MAGLFLRDSFVVGHFFYYLFDVGDDATFYCHFNYGYLLFDYSIFFYAIFYLCHITCFILIS